MIQGLSGLMLREKVVGYQPTIELSAKSIQKWAESLPIVNLAESAHSCYRLLVDINKTAISGEKRLQFLLVIESVSTNICHLLEKQFLINRIELSEKQRKIAALVQGIQTEIALAYHAAVEDLINKDVGWLGKKNLSKAIVKGISYHSQVIMRCFQLYTAIPGRLWHEIYTLYKLALRFEITDTKVDADAENEKSTGKTITQHLIRILLASTANPYQLKQSDTRLLWQELANFDHICDLKSHAFNNQHFVVDLDSSKPPVQKSLTSKSNGAHILKLSTHPAVEAAKLALAKLSKTGATGNAYKLLYRHLIVCWSQPPQRAFARTPCNEALEVSIGLGATHYLLSQSSLMAEDEAEPDTLDAMEGSLRNATLTEVAKAKTQQNKHSFDYLSSSGAPNADVWAKLYRPDQAVEQEPNAQLTNQRSKETIAKDNYKLRHTDLVNMSPGGYCLQFSAKDLPRHAQTGEVIGILEHMENATNPWTIGVIRWVKRVTKSDIIQMGVQLLAPAVLPVSIKSKNSREENAEYQRALLLPELSGLEQPATIITNPLSFSTSSKVRILDHGREYDARLYKELTASSSFRQFCFEKLSPPKSADSAFDSSVNHGNDNEPDNVWDLI